MTHSVRGGTVALNSRMFELFNFIIIIYFNKDLASVYKYENYPHIALSGE